MEQGDTVCFYDVLDTELDAIAARRGDASLPPKGGENAYRRAEKFGLVGLCFSGGGIRSATFNLGVLQGLHKLNVLTKIDYLSTVSGGGYIGSWFISWIKRLSAFPDLRGDVVDGEFKEPNPIRHLRRFSNYLTPKVGLMNADTWTIASTYLRNLILNALIIIPLFAAALLSVRLLELVPLLLGPISPRIIVMVGYGLLVVAAYCVGLNLVWEKDAAKAASTPRGINAAVKSSAAKKKTKVPLSFYAAVACTFVASYLGAYILVDANVEREIFSPHESALDWMMQGLFWYLGLWVFAWLLWLVLPFGKTKQGEGGSSDVASGLSGGSRPNLGSLFRGFRGWTSVLVGGLAAGPLAGLLFFYLYQRVPDLLYQELSDQMYLSLVLVFGMPMVMATLAFVVILQIGFAGSRFPDFAREWWSRFGAAMMIGVAVWVVGAGIAVFSGTIVDAVTGWVSGLQLTLAWLVTTVSGLLAAKSDKSGREGANRFIELFVKMTPAVFVVGIVILISYGIGVALQQVVPTASLLSLAIGACLLVSALFAWRVNVNTFSMNAMYYNRLVRCYLGASRENRMVNPVIGFDEKDDEFWTYEFRSYPGPYPIVNTAVNLVKGKELSWQKRKASSFVFTPHYCGFRSGIHDRYGTSGEFPIKLGKAISISGAAASPNMGYHSSAPLAFLMTIFNIRLGSWFPNPGVMRKGAEGYINTERGPGWGLLYLLSELFGLTDDTSRYVYLSDGGHFENLGLYELIRRRCKYIIVSDAAADPKLVFGDLGNAIEKCRADFGVEIELKTDALRVSELSGHSTAHVARGTIHYPRGRDGEDAFEGKILYIKATLTDDEPQDVRSYARAHAEFPHESTADQWFDESQFESYRRLGYHIASRLADAPIKSVVALYAPKQPEARRGVPSKAKRALRARPTLAAS
jgi:hypothetical protein